MMELQAGNQSFRRLRSQQELSCPTSVGGEERPALDVERLLREINVTRSERGRCQQDLAFKFSSATGEAAMASLVEVLNHPTGDLQWLDEKLCYIIVIE